MAKCGGCGEDLYCESCGWGTASTSSIPSTFLFDALVGIVNTAQACPDRCMADICNDNFLVHKVNLRAEMTNNKEQPIKITSNTKVRRGDE
jgi:hypothetical protein